MSQCVHRQQRCISGLIAEIIAELAAGELGTTRGLGGHEARMVFTRLAGDFMAHERERDTAEIAATAETGDNHVGIFPGHLHLLLGLQTDNRLMESHMVQHRTQTVFTVGGGAGQLHGFGNSRPQRPLIIWMGSQNIFSGAGGHRGGGGHLSPEGLHDAPAVGLLLI